MSEDTNNTSSVIELASKIEVTGARGKTFTLDMDKANRAAVEGMIAYAFGVIVQRSSASVDGFDKKIKAEADKAQELLAWEWQPGKRGGGIRLDERGAAERRILTTLFLSLGLKKSEAEKRAKAKAAWYDVTLVSMSKGKSKDEIPTEDEVNERLETKQSAISAMIDKEVEIEFERLRDMKAAMIDFDMS